MAGYLPDKTTCRGFIREKTPSVERLLDAGANQVKAELA
jgi:hypothetical protein